MVCSFSNAWRIENTMIKENKTETCALRLYNLKDYFWNNELMKEMYYLYYFYYLILFIY